MNKATRMGIVSAILVGFVSLVTVVLPSIANSATEYVMIGSAQHVINGTNIYRSTDFLVKYTPAKGATTGTNSYGYEAAVVDGKVTKVEDGVGNMAIPTTGYVLSGHGASRTWLRTYAKLGVTVNISSDPTPVPTGTATQPSGSPAQLPDLGVRTLRNFTIANVGGVKELKFPTVTANIGHGPFLINGTRTTTNSTDWVITQTIKRADGSTYSQSSPGSTFYYAGDGHNHWHIKDLDQFELLDPSGNRLRLGEKHGFCFEDNTSYRDWPSTGRNGTPRNPVVVPPTACGVGQPSSVNVMEGLSVGWGDTYPSTLPDQYINVTGLPDGNYTVRVTADWADWFDEEIENNNTAAALIKITGNTVQLLTTTGGL